MKQVDPPCMTDKEEAELVDRQSRAEAIKQAMDKLEELKGALQWVALITPDGDHEFTWVNNIVRMSRLEALECLQDDLNALMEEVK